MAPFLIPLKSLRRRGEAENHCSIMYVLPLPSEELGLTRWRIPSWINHPALFIRGDFEILNSGRFNKARLIFSRVHNYFIFRFTLSIVSHALVSNCQYVPLKDSVLCTERAAREERQRKVSIFSPLCFYRVDSECSNYFITSFFLLKAIVHKISKAFLISLPLKLIYWKREKFSYHL